MFNILEMYRFSVYPIYTSIGTLSVITLSGFRFCPPTKRVHRSKYDLIFRYIYRKPIHILTLNGQNS